MSAATDLADFARAPAAIEYGKCPCGGVYDAKEVEVRMTKSSRALRLDRVPQGVCPQCGSRVYKTHVLLLIETLFRED